MKRFIVLGGIIFFVLCAFGSIVIRNGPKKVQTPPSTKENYTAGIVIVVHNKPLDLTTPPYISSSKDIYMSAAEPQTINLKKQVTWKEFFETLLIGISPSCLQLSTNEHYCTKETVSLRFFLNGTEHPQVLLQSIQPHDQLLVSYGLLTQKDIQEQLKLLPRVE
jgi:hypothetical protein